MLSPREREKRDRRDSRGDGTEGQGRNRKRNEREETEEIKTFTSTLTCPTVSQYELDAPKVLCILRHRGIQLILAYSWARLANLVAGRGECFLFLLLLPFHSCSCFFPVGPLFHLLCYLFYPFLWEMTQNDPQRLMCR